MYTFFGTELDYRRALKKSETVDARSYHLAQVDIPLLSDNVVKFFSDFPQYSDFIGMTNLLSKDNSLQSEAIIALGEYTVFVDNKAVIF